MFIEKFLKWLTGPWHGFSLCVVGLIVGYWGFTITADNNSLGKFLFWLGWVLIAVGGTGHAINVIKEIQKRKKQE